MDRYAICQNGYHGRILNQKAWVVWDTEHGWERARFVLLVDAIMFVLAAHGKLIDWTEWT